MPVRNMRIEAPPAIRNQRQGRAFALVTGDPRNDEGVIAGKVTVNGIPTYALFDSGSTHSFISISRANRIDKILEPLDFDLIVSQPMSKGLICSSVLRNCEMTIGGESMTMDLIPLSMSHFNVIIGMDWLSKHSAKIDCT